LSSGIEFRVTDKGRHSLSTQPAANNRSAERRCFRCYLQEKYSQIRFGSVVALPPSMYDIGVGTVLVRLPISMAVEADFAGQVHPAVAVIAAVEHGSRVPAVALEDGMAQTVGLPFGDPQGAPGTPTPAEVVEEIHVFLSPSLL
jgi:hypothetical protein